MRRCGLVVCWMVTMVVVAGCSQSPPAQPLTSQTMSRVQPDPPPPSDPLVSPPEELSDATTTVIEVGGAGEGASTRSLLEAAEEAKKSREDQGPSVLVVTDKNLSDHALGKLTEAEPPPRPGPEAGAEGTAETDEQELGEEYWRRAALEHRVRWREATEDIVRLESDAAELRNRFYAEDDPWVRDGKIKPAWDRALDRLAQSREDALQAELALEAFLEDGRRAGALPGWLREGVHLEPERTQPDRLSPEDPRSYVVGEPIVVDEDG